MFQRICVCMALVVVLVFCSHAQAVVMPFAKGRSPHSEYSSQLCKKIGVDEKDQAVWRCKKDGIGERPVMRCHYVERSILKMVYCSDGSKIRLP